MNTRVGLDVGGAHLKVALAENGRPIDVCQILCPLWQGLDKLELALAEAAPLIARANSRAFTMTGELSDLFPDRATGVQVLLDRLEQALGPDTRAWMGVRGFGSLAEARVHPADVGSTNFLATAALVSRHVQDALLIDLGSTTADILPITGGTPAPLGLTDFNRQTTGELVYTGYTRTAVMGVTGRAPFKGPWVSLAREYLATMADVRRVLGVDLTGLDVHATADGKDKSLNSSIARLARMLGCDAGDGSLEEWRTVARFVREEQLRSIHDGALQVLSRCPLPDAAPVIAAGIGAREVADIAHRLGRPCVSFDALVDAPPALAPWVTACAPAVSLALLPG